MKIRQLKFQQEWKGVKEGQGCNYFQDQEDVTLVAISDSLRNLASPV